MRDYLLLIFSPALWALLFGLAAWILPIIGRIKHKSFSSFSWCCCAVTLWMPILATHMAVRLDDLAEVKDTIFAYDLAAIVLLIGTALSNIIFRNSSKNK